MPAGLCSVLIVVHNGAPFIAEALDSILSQTATPLECVVIDDGSTDGTAAILAGYSDSRLVVHHRARLGYGHALSYGMKVVRGELVAILDADDIAAVDRLEIQQEYLRAHPGVGLVGSAYVLFGECAARTIFLPTGRDHLRRSMGIRNPFCHSSVMIRRSAYEDVGGYDPDRPWGQDYDLILRIAQKFELAMLPQVLVAHRIHSGQLTADPRTDSMRRRQSALLAARAIRRLRLPPGYYLFPIASFLYTLLPPKMRPHTAKEFFKRLLGLHAVENGKSSPLPILGKRRCTKQESALEP